MNQTAERRKVLENSIQAVKVKSLSQNATKEKIREIQVEIPGLNLTDLEVNEIAHNLELLETMLKRLDEIDVTNLEPTVVFTRREE